MSWCITSKGWQYCGEAHGSLLDRALMCTGVGTKVREEAEVGGGRGGAGTVYQPLAANRLRAKFTVATPTCPW